MLIYVDMEFAIEPSVFDEQAGNEAGRFVDFVDYRNKMMQYGFVLRRECVRYEDAAKKAVHLNAILGHETAIEDAETFERLVATWLEMKKYCVDVSIKTYEVLADYSYCRHERWEELCLCHNHVWGTPSFLCAECGGVIAAYRLGLSWGLYEKLFMWEYQKDAIEALSALAGEYEEWADAELRDKGSAIKRLGESLRGDLEKDLGSRVVME